VKLILCNIGLCLFWWVTMSFTFGILISGLSDKTICDETPRIFYPGKYGCITGKWLFKPIREQESK